MTNQMQIGRCRLHVWDTSAELRESLEPITLTIYSGAMHLHEYVTPVQARELALELLAAAERAESDG